MRCAGRKVIRALLEWPAHAAIKPRHEWGSRHPSIPTAGWPDLVFSHPCAIRPHGWAPEHLWRVEEMQGSFASPRMTDKDNGKATANSSLFGFAQGRLPRYGMGIQGRGSACSRQQTNTKPGWRAGLREGRLVICRLFLVHLSCRGNCRRR